MSFSLTANANPGVASWSGSSAVIAAAGVATVDLDSDGPAKTITVPAGLESAPILISYNNDPASYGVAGGRTYSSITGTTLTINFISSGDPYVDGFLVSWAVLATV